MDEKNLDKELDERLKESLGNLSEEVSSESQWADMRTRILKEGLNVRQTEALVSRLTRKDDAAPKGAVPEKGIKDANVTSLENRLRERLGTKVQLRYAQGKGALEIHFFSDAELERLLQIIGVVAD